MVYQDYCKFFAATCSRCKGDRRININGTWGICSCQRLANLKWKLEQIEVSPPELKYKNWDDFCGHGKGGQGKLTSDSFLSAKLKALSYCFNVTNPDTVQKAIKSRRNHLIVHQHMRDGQNVIIVGQSGSGRSLLSILIIKEVLYASYLFGLNLSVKSIGSHELVDALRWDNTKPIDRVLSDELSETDFLMIDDIDLLPKLGHHTGPPDLVSMEILFGTRGRYHRPTIITCSPKFYSEVVRPQFFEQISAQWGKEFVSLMTDSSNVVIQLEKDT